MKKIISAITLLAVLALSGCGKVTPSASFESVTEPATLQAVTEPATTPDKMKLIGDKASGSNVFVITIDNRTGRDIVGFSVRSGSEGQFPKNMLRSDDPFLKDEKRILYYVPVNSEGYAIGDSDAIASEEFLIKIDFKDGSHAVLHQFPFGDLDECVFRLENNFAYVEYTSKSTDQKVSTRDAEEMIKSNEPEEEPTTKKTDDDDDYSYEPVYTAPAYEEPVYTQPATTQYIAPTTQYVAPTTQYVEPITQAPAPTEAPTNAAQDPNGGCIANQGGGALTW